MNFRTEFKNVKTAEEAIEKAKLNWLLEQQEIITAAGINVPNHKAVIREDNKKVLGVVGKNYQPIQNQHAFSFFDAICRKHNAEYRYAYCLNGGAKIILQAKINCGFEVQPGDHIDKYITLLNSHDGTTGLKAYFTPIRLFCANQLNVSLKKSTQNISLRHTTSIESRIQEAFRVFSMGINWFNQFQKQAKYLAQKTVDKRMVERFLDEVVGKEKTTRTKNKRDKVIELFESGKGNNGNSAWDLANGVIEHVDHYSSKDPVKRFKSALLGGGALIKQKAFNVALAL